MAAELSDEQIEDVKTVFFATEKSHGVAGSGRLSGKAVAKGMLSLGLDVATVNVKPEANYDLGQFTALVRTATEKTALSKRELQTAFKEWDADAKGFISPAQLRHLIVNSGEIPGISGRDIDEMLHEVDKNGDGRIDLPEFISFLVSHKE